MNIAEKIKTNCKDESHFKLIENPKLFMVVVVVDLKNAGVVLMTENFMSDEREGEKVKEISMLHIDCSFLLKLYIVLYVINCNFARRRKRRRKD